MIQKRPLIYDFLDAAQYLEAYFKWRKSQEPKFSYSAWASELNLGSKVTLRFIIQKRRRISIESLEKLKKHLGLSPDETKYFEVLVAYSQARTSSEQKSLAQQLVSIQRSMYRQKELNLSAADEAYGPIVLTLLTFDDLKKDARTLSELLELPEENMRDILRDLIKNHQIHGEPDNTYSVDFDAFKINPPPGSGSLRRFHEFWLEQSKRAIDLPLELRRFRSLKFALSEEEFQSILQQINEFALNLLSRYHSTGLEGRRLYMFESALFPVSRKFTSVSEPLKLGFGDSASETDHESPSDAVIS